MNVYLITQDEYRGSNSYYSAVVVARNEDEARTIHPDGWSRYVNNVWINESGTFTENRYAVYNGWRSENIKVELIGVADSKYTEPRVINSSLYDARSL